MFVYDKTVFNPFNYKFSDHVVLFTMTDFNGKRYNCVECSKMSEKITT